MYNPHALVTLHFWGRIDNLEDLSSALGYPAKETDLNTLIESAWMRWGESMPEHLLGDFALSVEIPSEQKTFLARDPLGVKPLYYTIQHGKLHHAFSVAELRKNPELTLTPDPDWMARYVLHLSVSHTLTGYREVFKLPPGHTLTYTPGKEPIIRSYHHWRNDAPWASSRNPQWVERYQSVLEESIRCRMDFDAPMGTENSGGIDSATITAYLAHFLGEPGDRLHSFGFATCEQEPAMILATSQARRIVHNYLITTHHAEEDWDRRVDRVLDVLGYPEEHGNGSSHIPFYEECRLKRPGDGGGWSHFALIGGDLPHAFGPDDEKL